MWLHAPFRVTAIVLLCTAIASIRAARRTSQTCLFQVYHNKALYEHNDRPTLLEQRPEECKAACIEAGADCASFDYIRESGSCYLSSQSAVTQPHAFDDHAGASYYEKRCGAAANTVDANSELLPPHWGTKCNYKHTSNKKLVGHELNVIKDSNIKQCLETCFRQAKKCFSFNYDPRTHECTMNSATQFVVAQSALVTATGFIYVEKKCGDMPENQKSECRSPIDFNDMCYNTASRTLDDNYQSAESLCQNEDMHLLEVKTDAERQYLYAPAVLVNELTSGQVTGSWTTGSRAATTECAYQWKDGSPIENVKWAAGEPACRNSENTRVALVLEDNDLVLKEMSPSAGLFAVCEYPKPPGPPCPHHMHLCGTSSRCIPLQFRCDGDPDCEDHSDEQNCNRVERESISRRVFWGKLFWSK